MSRHPFTRRTLLSGSATALPLAAQRPQSRAGKPNIIVILLDDVGFGQTSTFGGLIPTPELDKLAAEGLRFTRFHTTAICGPSRAALLTGRNHHQSGNGFLMEYATGFPSYSTMMSRDTATIGEIQEAQDRVDKAAAAVKQDAIATKDTPAMQNVQKAVKELRAAVDNLPPSTTADQAKAKIQPQVNNLKNALGQVQKNLACPRG